MTKVRDFLIAGVALVIMAYALMGFVERFIPVLVLLAVASTVYAVFFKRRRW